MAAASQYANKQMRPLLELPRNPSPGLREATHRLGGYATEHIGQVLAEL